MSTELPYEHIKRLHTWIVSSGNLYKIPDDSHLPTCWRLVGCTNKRCPVFGKEKQRCWQINGTICKNHSSSLVINNFPVKCVNCTVFQLATGNNFQGSFEMLNNIIFKLTGFGISHFTISQSLSSIGVDIFTKKYGLSERETSLLSYLITNTLRKEIAVQLDISINTIKTHIKKLLKKTGVKSVPELKKLIVENFNSFR
jgi:DNA-binding CsgD family transcriptional regulator